MSQHLSCFTSADRGKVCYSNLTCVQLNFQLCLMVHFQELLALKLHHLILSSVVLCGYCHRLCLGSTGVDNSPLGSWSPYQTKRPSEGYLVGVRSVADLMSCETRLFMHCRSHHELKAYPVTCGELQL